MEAGVNFLKTLLTRTDANATLATDSVKGVQPLSNDEPAMATKASNLPGENQKSLESLLAENARGLPNQIKEKLQKASTGSILSRMLNLLVKHKTEIAYTTAGALAISVLGYIASQYVVRQVRNARNEGRHLHDRDMADMEDRITQALEVRSKKLGKTLAHAEDVEDAISATKEGKLARLDTRLDSIEGVDSGAVAKDDAERPMSSCSLPSKTWMDDSYDAKNEANLNDTKDDKRDDRSPLAIAKAGQSTVCGLEPPHNKANDGATDNEVSLEQDLEGGKGDSATDKSLLDSEWEVIMDQDANDWVGGE
ncbi:uncharacterized protein BDZ99DRAFT_458549 [Mytilinidion resinicola]|uniref:Uncharacterized protein n=1 Tax=Mytilinidion resinicola TaxID=574789 RepID=A0A6A6Z0H2_9PEZI|nr:uncharacterized protein BDZ99DRAFT_458549 [Mytilinidion resinicola]KAF2814520.1 hypothetical protein BDZ99DRAFT_458549 [Mytilinidion resinicola]